MCSTKLWLGGASACEGTIDNVASLPLFLQAKGVETWLSETILHLRKKNCGREEIAWVLGLPLEALSDLIPSSVAPELIGQDLLNMGFLPRGAGCFIKECRGMAFLNGRRCTLCRHCTDEASHALVVVDGGNAEQPDYGGPCKQILLSRKNLEFAHAPVLDSSSSSECDHWPSISSLPPDMEDIPISARSTVELLGESWFRLPSWRPHNLYGPEVDEWLTGVVDRLVTRKDCGREELAYLFNFEGAVSLFGGSAVPKSITPQQYGILLHELAFVPQGFHCQVEGSSSFPHLNGCVGKLVEACPDGHSHANVSISGYSDLMINRKHLRLLGTSPEQKNPFHVWTDCQEEGASVRDATNHHRHVREREKEKAALSQAKDHSDSKSSSSDPNEGFLGWLQCVFGCNCCSNTKQPATILHADSSAPAPQQPAPSTSRPP